MQRWVVTDVAITLHLFPAADVDSLQLDTAIVAKLWVPNASFVYVQSVTRPKLLSDASGITLYRNKTIAHVSTSSEWPVCRGDTF